MAIKSTKKPLLDEPAANEDTDFSAELIKQINKEAGNKIAFNLGTDEAPTTVKRWISTGSKQLDYIISNRRNGGVAEGRIVEIQGPPSSGKSHIAYEIAKSTQRMNGIVVYIDTENATSVENLEGLGIDIRKRFVFIQETCIEDIFKVIESTIEKARNLKADVPVTVIWDSVAASAPKAEIEGDYDQNTIGLAARVLSKGFRKITDIIGDKNVCLVLLNQQRQKIGVMYGDPNTTPGGMAIPYHASTRIKLTGGQQIKQSINGKEAVIGINVTCKTIKNKVARPWREVSFEIHFGKGVREDENLFDELRDFCAKCKDPVMFEGKRIIVEGASQWKYFQVIDNKTGAFVVDEKFYKSEFGSRVLRNPEYEDYINTLMDAAFIMVNGDDSHKTVASIDLGNASEVEAVKVEKLGKTGKSLLLD